LLLLLLLLLREAGELEPGEQIRESVREKRERDDGGREEEEQI